MRTVQLGTSSLRVSRLAYGCWRIAGTWDASAVSREAEGQGTKAAVAAYEAGTRFFDHADIYCDGVAEQFSAKALKQVPGMRERIVIATKCGIRKECDPNPDSPFRYEFSAEHIISSCEQSLKRLGTDVIDVLPTPCGPIT